MAMTDRLDEIFTEYTKAADFRRGCMDCLVKVLAAIDHDAAARFIVILLGARDRRARIFSPQRPQCGHGQSFCQ